MQGDENFDPDRELHDAIVALYPKIEASRIFFRNRDLVSVRLESQSMDSARPAVDRDLAICAMLTKAANTKRAIRVLCDAGLADDAYALTRVLMENVINLAWILSDDWINRIDMYLLSFAAAQCRLEKVVREHLPEGEFASQVRKEIRDVTRYISREVFDNKYLDWYYRRTPAGKKEPVKMRDRVVELEESPNAKELKTGPASYALVFFHSSQHIHALPESLTPTIEELLREPRIFSVRHRTRCERADLALAMSNMWMLFALSSFNRWVGGEMEQEIDALWKRLAEQEPSA